MLTNVKEITLVTRTRVAQTQLDHMYINATPDSLKMDVIAQVNLMAFRLTLRKVHRKYFGE